MAVRRQVEAKLFALATEQGMGGLNEYASAVSRLRVAAGSPAVPQVDQDFEAFLDNLVGLLALDVGDHAHAAAIVFLLRRVQPLLGQLF